MAIRVEKDNAVWTVIHSRPEVQNAMDPDSAVALYEAFLTFDLDDSARAAVFWGEGGAFCAGWDLKHASALSGVEARQTAEVLAHDITRFPQSCKRADRRSVRA